MTRRLKSIDRIFTSQLYSLRYRFFKLYISDEREDLKFCIDRMLRGDIEEEFDKMSREDLDNLLPVLLNNRDNTDTHERYFCFLCYNIYLRTQREDVWYEKEIKDRIIRAVSTRINESVSAYIEGFPDKEHAWTFNPAVQFCNKIFHCSGSKRFVKRSI